MKKTKYVILMCSFVLLSGCVKSNTTMVISKDKSMSLSSEILISDKVNDDKNKLIIKDEKDKLQKKGVIIENVESSNGYGGFRVTKKYDNIDKISSEEYKEINISNFLSDDFDDSVLFQVKKGMFKNVYTANYKFEVDEDSFSNVDDNTNSDETIIEDPNIIVDDTNVTTNNNTDLIKLTSEMEFKYIVKLPYKAIESNSTVKSDNDKTLEWNLNSNSTIMINYSFELYNMNNIYMAVGICIGCIVLLIILTIIKNKIVQRKRDKISSRPILKEYDPSIEDELFDNNTKIKSTDYVSIENNNVNDSVNNKEEIKINNGMEMLEKTQIINIPEDVK